MTLEVLSALTLFDFWYRVDVDVNVVKVAFDLHFALWFLCCFNFNVHVTVV